MITEQETSDLSLEEMAMWFQSEIAWAKSFEAAMATARASKKLVMVDFYADWCKVCKMQDEKTYTDARVIQLSGRLVSVKVNAEQGNGPQLAKAYGVQGYPTIAFLDGAGTKIQALSGYIPPTSFLTSMQLALTAEQLPALEAKPQKDALLVSKLVQIYAGLGQIEKADTALTVLLKGDPTNTSRQVAIACNAVGDMYQAKESFVKAIAFFEKAAQLGKTPQERAYALMSIGVCYRSQGNKVGAKQFFEKTLALPDCPPLERGQTRSMLDSLGRR